MKKQLFLFILLPLLLGSCSYLKYAAVQAEYSRIHRAEPGQINVKHMIDHETFFVIGKLIDKTGGYGESYLAVAAFSDKFREHERVDTMYFAGAGTHFGLNLPEGTYTILVFADLNRNAVYEPTEVVGQKSVVLNETVAPEKGLVHVDIALNAPDRLGWVENIPMPDIAEPRKSLFFPVGTIRELDDPLFDENMATIGMYDPAAFNEQAPTMFYALEEDFGYKVPVIFVHGIGGTPRAFSSIVARLDRRRYKPWFCYYPSGGDLEQLGSLFYKIFLSGQIAKMEEMPVVIIAHSMGGLVVREAINHLTGDPGENVVELFISIATPFGGHPAAAAGEKHGLITLPSWRDVNPESMFLKELYRNPLPETLEHHLIYAYQNPDIVKINENSDGVVPLSSQLYPIVQEQSYRQFGFNSSHTSILDNDEMISYVLELIEAVENVVPEEHLLLLFEGGYEVSLGSEYSPLGVFTIRNYGKYIAALIQGRLDPFYPEQDVFLQVVRGEMAPRNEVERDWVRFMDDFPEKFD